MWEDLGEIEAHFQPFEQSQILLYWIKKKLTTYFIVEVSPFQNLWITLLKCNRFFKVSLPIQFTFLFTLVGDGIY